MFYIHDFPQLGDKTKLCLSKVNRDDKYKNALNAFKKLVGHFKFDDNDDGQRYLRFWLSDDNMKVYPFIGTRIKFEKPKNIRNSNGNNRTIYYRNIVVPYEPIFDEMFYPKNMLGGKLLKNKSIKPKK